MADISVIKLPSGSSYNIKDAVAREDIATLKGAVTGGMHYLGVTSSAISDGSSTNPITIGSDSVTAKAGDIVIKGSLEFIFSSTDNKWHEFGSTGSLKGLAFKDSASGKVTPSGTVSTPTITVNPTTAKKFVASSASAGGSVSAGTAASCTLPSLTTSVASETLTISWSAGSFTANTPTGVTLPSFTEETVVTGITSATSTQPTFTGSEASVSVS